MHIPAFYIFSNEGLRAIAGGDIRTKEDLLFIKGINKRKYDLYGDDLFEIIQKFIDEENEGRKKIMMNNPVRKQIILLWIASKIITGSKEKINLIYFQKMF